MTSPALNANSRSAMVTWSHTASALTIEPPLINWKNLEGETGNVLCYILLTWSNHCGNTTETATTGLQTLTNKYGYTWSTTASKSNLKMIVIQYPASFWSQFVWILVVKPTQITNRCKYTPSKPGPTGSLGTANRTTQWHSPRHSTTKYNNTKKAEPVVEKQHSVQKHSTSLHTGTVIGPLWH